MDNLEEIRKKIDAVDAQIAPLFEQRMELVREVTAYKTAHGLATCDPSREDEILRRGAERVQDRDIREYYVGFQKEVLSLSRDWQRRLSSGLILGGITYVYRLLYLVPPQEQSYVFPLAEAGPARRLVVVEDPSKPVGMEKG